MAVQSHDVVIGGDTYTINTFVATKGVKYLKKLLKVIGPAMAEAMAGSDGEEIRTDGLGKAAEILFDNIDSEGFDDMIIEWVKNNVTKNGQPVVFDMEFAGDYGKLMQLVKEIIMLNFATVFQNGFGGLLPSQANPLKP